MNKESYLKKRKKDFQAEGSEIPDELINEVDNLGTVLSDDEINDWLRETKKVFSILLAENKSAFDRLYCEYVLDIDYLLELKRVDKDQAENLKDLERFKF